MTDYYNVRPFSLSLMALHAIDLFISYMYNLIRNTFKPIVHAATMPILESICSFSSSILQSQFQIILNASQDSPIWAEICA